VKVLLVSGIWPPDIGGPASHGPEFGRFLVGRGHEVRGVTTADEAGPLDPGFPLTSSPRDRPRTVRLSRAALAVLAASPRAEVIYAIGMHGRSAVASTVMRIPLVLKLASDPAFERARSLGVFSGTLEEFQQPHRGPALRALKRLRMLSVSRASRIIVPSGYLAGIVRRWGLPAERVSVVPNPAPPVDCSTSRDALRKRLGLRTPTFVFAGRFVPAKNLPLAILALRHVPNASLVLIGDGPERDKLTRVIAESGHRDRVRVRGVLPRSEAIEWLRAADAAVLSSDSENFPHTAVEALAAGTPVIATSVGGVPEIVETGVNGILVSPGDVPAFGQAMASLVENRALLKRLREGARDAGSRYRVDVAFAAIERELELAVTPRIRARPASDRTTTDRRLRP
jgi:glycosyltransferase involved in cell wall biosynthesis